MDIEAEKRLAAERAVEFVESGMAVGLGSGSTAAHAVRALARRVADGLRVEAIPTSRATEELARSLGIALTDFDRCPHLDLTIDGADEIDADLRAIKGGGGAFLREKVVAENSTRMIAIVDSTKLVTRLGACKVPLEVLPFAARTVIHRVAAMGATVDLRLAPGGQPQLTDQANYILDAHFAVIEDPNRLANTLNRIPGLLAHGLFLSEIDLLIVGAGTATDIRLRPETDTRPRP